MKKPLISTLPLISVAFTISHGRNGGSIPPSRTPLAPLSRASLLDCGFPGVFLSILHSDSNPLLLLHSWTWLPFCLFPPIKNGPYGPFYWWKRWESNPYSVPVEITRLYTFLYPNCVRHGKKAAIKKRVRVEALARSLYLMPEEAAGVDTSIELHVNVYRISHVGRAIVAIGSSVLVCQLLNLRPACCCSGNSRNVDVRRTAEPVNRVFN